MPTSFYILLAILLLCPCQAENTAQDVAEMDDNIAQRAKDELSQKKDELEQRAEDLEQAAKDLAEKAAQEALAQKQKDLEEVAKDVAEAKAALEQRAKEAQEELAQKTAEWEAKELAERELLAANAKRDLEREEHSREDLQEKAKEETHSETSREHSHEHRGYCGVMNITVGMRCEDGYELASEHFVKKCHASICAELNNWEMAQYSSRTAKVVGPAYSPTCGTEPWKGNPLGNSICTPIQEATEPPTTRTPTTDAPIPTPPTSAPPTSAPLQPHLPGNYMKLSHDAPGEWIVANATNSIKDPILQVVNKGEQIAGCPAKVGLNIRAYNVDDEEVDDIAVDLAFGEHATFPSNWSSIDHITITNDVPGCTANIAMRFVSGDAFDDRDHHHLALYVACGLATLLLFSPLLWYALRRSAQKREHKPLIYNVEDFETGSVFSGE